jgi:hypothetical protein
MPEVVYINERRGMMASDAQNGGRGKQDQNSWKTTSHFLSSLIA